MGAKDMHHEFNAFLAEMDAIIAQASPQAEPDPAAVSSAEVAAFERLELLARRQKSA